MPTRLGYDVSTWEEIRSIVKPKTYRLVDGITKEISNDQSLAEFQGKHPVPWQLREIMAQRAEAWIQRIYDSCCDAYKERDKVPSADFDRAVWAFWIEPFIMGEKERGGDYSVSMLLELLLCAVGSPPLKRRWLKVSENNCCLDVRGQVFGTWYHKLHHLPSRIDQAVAAMARANELEARAVRIVRGLSPESQPQTPMPNPAPPSVQPSATAPQSAKETLFAGVPIPPPVERIQEGSGEGPQGVTKNDTAAQLSGARVATWDAIEILFLSDERIQIRDGSTAETRNYAEFGFVDGRSGKPNQAWEILRELAEQSGVIREARRGPQAWPKLEKRIQEIRKALREHFGVTSDPIPFVEGIGYQACFKVGCSLSFHT